MKKIDGNLYIVPTPIGNLRDITLRALDILKTVDIIGAEDTRTSGILLNNFNISTKTVSYHKFNEKSKSDYLIAELKKGKNIAIISDAGMPGISDPANIIIKKAIDSHISVIALPGANAFLPALVASGMNTEKFFFAGFLPSKLKLRQKLFADIYKLESTLIFYETSKRLIKTLSIFQENLGDRKICLAREISKIYENYTRSTISELLNNPSLITLKGEFVIVLEGYIETIPQKNELFKELQELCEKNSIPKALEILQKRYNLSRNLTYELKIKIQAHKKEENELG